MPSGRHSAKFECFFKKILCRVPWSWHSAKLEKWFFERPFFQLCWVLWPWHSTTGSFAECNTQQSDPKRQFLIFFYIPSWQINSYKHISQIYLIHHIYISFITYISHPSTYPSAHITSITICITYIIISAQVHPNKSTSPLKSTSASQVHHQVNNKCKKYNMHSSRPLRLWWRPRCIIRRCMRWIIRTTIRWRLHKGEKIACETRLFW